MSEFIIAYHMGKDTMSKMPSTPEEGAAHMAKWQEWINGLGDAVVNPGTPLKASVFVNGGNILEDGGSEPLNGYAIVKAENLEAAIEIAKTDPFCQMGGTVEVAEIMNMRG